MKKGYILAVAALLAAMVWPASAQQFRVGVEAGGTISHSSWKFDDSRKTKGVGGYTIGLTAEYEILDNTWLQSGLSFLTKGAMNERGDVRVEANILRYEKYTYRPMYVQIPITIAYKFGLTPRIRFFVSGGGFLSQGLGGEYNREWTYNNNWADDPLSKNVFSYDALKRFDCGLSVGGGFEFGKLILRAGHDWSLLNIAKDKTILGTGEFKNRSIAIVAGLKF